MQAFSIGVHGPYCGTTCRGHAIGLGRATPVLVKVEWRSGGAHAPLWVGVPNPCHSSFREGGRHSSTHGLIGTRAAIVLALVLALLGSSCLPPLSPPPPGFPCDGSRSQPQDGIAGCRGKALKFWMPHATLPGGSSTTNLSPPRTVPRRMAAATRLRAGSVARLVLRRPALVFLLVNSLVPLQSLEVHARSLTMAALAPLGPEGIENLSLPCQKKSPPASRLFAQPK
jgi:hypothetical protein